ncbi:MAG: Nif3-like dinuclear metal center hexameric protein [Candidatus Electrothrix sp. AR4]|nr:Nif3-like dinuclear metal center hexameric protein [Candidatus Electrothrix sp. AR4]
MPLFLCIVVKVQDLLNILQDIAPNSLAQAWDNVGLLVGSPHDRVTSVLLALDPTVPLVAAAQDCAAELIITHHPAIFHPLKSLRADQPVGHFIFSAVQAGINVIGCHTNLDSTCGGVNDVLAQLLGVIDTVPLLPDTSESCDRRCGLGRVGVLRESVLPEAFVVDVYKALSAPWLLEAGLRPESVSKVAVCGGSCSDLSATALSAGADVFITSEVKHDVARWAEAVGLWLLDAGHYSTENLAMEGLRQLLADRLHAAGMNVRLHLGHQEAPLRLVARES